MVELNDYLYVFLGGKASDKIGGIELDKIIFNSILNGWINQAHLQCFGWETIAFNPFLTRDNILF